MGFFCGSINRDFFNFGFNVPQKEIAEQLNMNYVTVRSKVQRGRKKLLEGCCLILQGGKGSILGFEPKM